jgi:hypothetical protein
MGTIDLHAGYNGSKSLLSDFGGQEAVFALVLDSDGFRL